MHSYYVYIRIYTLYTHVHTHVHASEYIYNLILDFKSLWAFSINRKVKEVKLSWTAFFHLSWPPQGCPDWLQDTWYTGSHVYPSWVAPLPLAGRLQSCLPKHNQCFLGLCIQTDQPGKLGLPFTLATGQGEAPWSPVRGFESSTADSESNSNLFYSQHFHLGVLSFSSQSLEQYEPMAFSGQAS